MTIAEIIRNGKGRAGSNGSWVAYTDYPVDPFSPWQRYELWHYSHRMAVWNRNRQTGEAVEVTLAYGHGSVSDQQGMNTLFRELNLPYYYSRAGGATIQNTVTGELYYAE